MYDQKHHLSVSVAIMETYLSSQMNLFSEIQKALLFVILQNRQITSHFQDLKYHQVSKEDLLILMLYSDFL